MSAPESSPDRYAPCFPLSREEFEDALRKGLGRAPLHVRRFGAAGIEDFLVYACLHNRAFDSQCEGSRERWLIELLDAADLTDQFERPILKAQLHRGTRSLHSADSPEGRADRQDEEWDRWQMHRLAVQYARRGSASARRVLRVCFRRSLRDWATTDDYELACAEEAASCSGPEQLLYVAQHIGRRIVRGIPDKGITDVRYAYDEHHGEGAAMSALEAAGKADRFIAVYLNELLEQDRGREIRSPRQAYEERKEQLRAISGLAVLHRFDTDPTAIKSFPITSWVGVAPLSEQRPVAERIFTTSDAKLQQRLLYGFIRKGLPQFDMRLVALLDDDDEDTQWFAAQTLSHHRHPLVRAAALERLRRRPFWKGAIKLLCSNYEAGDHDLIEALLTPGEDDEDAHDLVTEILDLFTRHETPVAAASLLFVYRHSPCENCRRDAVEMLKKLDAAPPWLQEECAFDSDDQVRACFRAAPS